MSIYWYENDKDLFRSEVIAMNKFYPNFKLKKMPDGRLYWRGVVNPCGPGGAYWDLMLIYDNDHPYTNGVNTYGGSIKVFPVNPRLEDIVDSIGDVPHIFRDQNHDLFICTVKADQFKTGDVSSSASSCLSWACKWIVVFELYINGDVGKEVFDHTY